MYGINVADLYLQDLQAALDVLAAQPEVDADRIGCLGNSTGGRMTMWLSIFDPRVKACVSSGSMNTFRERSLKLASCAIQYPFGLLRYGDVPELFSLIAPKPLQLQAGAQDGLITRRTETQYAKQYTALISELGATDHLNYMLHEEGHIMIWKPANSFFDRFLKTRE